MVKSSTVSEILTVRMIPLVTVIPTMKSQPSFVSVSSFYYFKKFKAICTYSQNQAVLTNKNRVFLFFGFIFFLLLDRTVSTVVISHLLKH